MEVYKPCGKKETRLQMAGNENHAYRLLALLDFGLLHAWAAVLACLLVLGWTDTSYLLEADEQIAGRRAARISDMHGRVLLPFGVLSLN